MIIDMLEALRIKSNSGSAITKLKDAEEKLFELRELALKQSRGEDFDVQDNQVIRNFATMYELVQAGSNSFYWHNSSLDVAVKQVIADPKLIFQYALKCNASAIILSHNHPSGNCQPSEGDNQLTKKVKQGGDILDIKIIDHIIVTPEENCFYSMADSGDIFN